MISAAQLEKQVLRTKLRDALRQISPDERGAQSAETARLIQQQPQWHAAKAVLFYSALSGELDLAPLVPIAFQQSKLVFFPRFDPGSNAYEAALVSGANDLCTGAYGILEPAPACPSYPLKQLDFLLVPGLGFDIAGRRLGRGKGFYDRLLSESSGIKCGVCYDRQVEPRVPSEVHDQMVDYILTPTRFFRVPCDMRS